MKGSLLADAGSTKTDWALLIEESEEKLRYTTKGINPALQSEEEINNIISNLAKQISESIGIKRIYFYGAGCAFSNYVKVIGKTLFQHFPDAEISVASDLLGASIALFGNSSGIACILGTGSNSCVFENGEIKSQTPSLGYILGDEGSGCALGKRLLNMVFKRRLSNDIIEKFHKEYNISVKDVIENIYRNDNPSAYLASFAPFILKNINYPEIYNLASREFLNFFQYNVVQYGKPGSRPLGIVGSIGINFQNIIENTANRTGFTISKFLQSPIEGIIDFHSSILFNQ